MDSFIFVADSADENVRADMYLSEKQKSFTRSSLEKLFSNGNILVNGFPASKSHRLRSGDKIELIPSPKVGECSVKLYDLSLDLLYEDDYLLVVNKPKGLLVHPSQGGGEDTLTGALLNHCGESLSSLGGSFRPGIVHRIDKDTSGLLVAAKTDSVHEALAKQFEAHSALRRYIGITEGVVRSDSGVVDAPISRHPVHRTKNCVPKNSARARKAVTHYRVIARYPGFTCAEFRLETGRTHQIRVHMAHIGHPLAGDVLYGAKPVKILKGQCLHAGTLGFEHPISGKRMEFHTEPPQYFEEFLQMIRKWEDT